VKEIPLCAPLIGKEEADAARRAILDGHIDGNGTICARVEKRLEEMFGGACMLTTSCTTA